jgi:hypothetical protein
VVEELRDTELVPVVEGSLLARGREIDVSVGETVEIEPSAIGTETPTS